jgi:hypothetical protein
MKNKIITYSQFTLVALLLLCLLIMLRSDTAELSPDSTMDRFLTYTKFLRFGFLAVIDLLTLILLEVHKKRQT